MRRLRTWLRRLGGALGVNRREREMSDEIESHLQLHIDDNLRTGMTPDEARRQASLSLGGQEALKEAYRDQWRIPLLDHLAQDLRYSVRALRRGTGIAAIAMLAIAIGMSTAMFTLVNALLLRPVPFPHADRLANLHMWTEHGGRTGVSSSVIEAWRRTAGIEAVEGALAGTAVLDVNNQPVVAQAAFVTPGLFEMLGAWPIRGRLLDPEESHASRGDRVLVSEDLWRSQFQSDAGIIGRTVRLDNSAVVIIGILPRWFHYPEWNSSIWRPLGAEAFDRLTGGDPVAIVRFSPTMVRAEALNVATVAAQAADPRTRPMHAVPTELVSAAWDDSYYKHALPVLAGAVGFMFLALCSNVCSLLLTRFNARRREFAVCSALGASRRRIAQRALVEAVAISVLGTIGGVSLALLIVAVAHRLLPQKMLAATLTPLTIDAYALLVAILLGVTATLVTGLFPAIVATRSVAASSTGLTERAGTESRTARAVTRGLLIGETSLAVVLLIGSTLLVRSFVNLSRIDRGFDPRGRVAVSIGFDRSIQGRPARAVVAEQAEDELRGLPGVQRVAWSSGGPLTYGNLYFYHWRTDRAGAAPVNVQINSAHVGSDFFDIYDIPLIKGRTFGANELRENVVIGDRLAAALWPDMDPIGHTFQATPDLRFRVIGVVKEVRRALVAEEYVQMYEPRSIDSYGGLLSLKCQTSCPSEGVIRRRLMSAVPGAVVFRVTPMEETYLADLAQPRASATLASLFAAVALITAAGGLFGALSHAVGRRKREFGIRFALGASITAVRGLVLREGLLVVTIGLVAGSAGAWGAARALASVQFGVTVADPVSWAIVLSVIGMTAAIAFWRPARSATRIDPAALLKEQ
jgi:macrolide transport system ATP-binding/permease protein